MIRALLAPLLIITVSVLLTVVACAASAGAATSGGWTTSGTVTGKGYEPPRPGVVECSGTGRTPGSCRTVDQPECWRLDLRNGIFAGWACAPDRATWDRVRIGDWWPS